MSGPSLSVVVPVYNGGSDLTGCLESLERACEVAAGVSLDVTISDNHSTDGTAAVVAAFAERRGWRVMRPARHLPRSLHWDYALGHGRGDWLVMLHADDRLTPDALAAYFGAAATAALEVVLLSGRYRRLSEDGTTESADLPSWLMSSQTIDGQLLRRRVLSVHNVFLPFTAIRRSCFDAVGGLDTSYELLQDWDLWYRALALGDAVFLPETVGLWRQHGISAGYAETFAAEHRRFARRLPALGGTGPAGVALSRAVQLVRARAITGSRVATTVLRPALALTALQLARARRAS